MLYIAMSGAKQTMQAQAANANNLANVATTGFREDLQAFSSQALTGAGHPSRVYSVTGETGVNLAPGTQVHTGNELGRRLARAGSRCRAGRSGSHTRAGDPRLTPNGMLVTGSGHPVLGDSGAPVSIPPAERSRSRLTAPSRSARSDRRRRRWR